MSTPLAAALLVGGILFGFSRPSFAQPIQVVQLPATGSFTGVPHTASGFVAWVGGSSNRTVNLYKIQTQQLTQLASYSGTTTVLGPNLADNVAVWGAGANNYAYDLLAQTTVTMPNTGSFTGTPVTGNGYVTWVGGSSNRTVNLYKLQTQQLTQLASYSGTTTVLGPAIADGVVVWGAGANNYAYSLQAQTTITLPSTGSFTGKPVTGNGFVGWVGGSSSRTVNAYKLQTQQLTQLANYSGTTSVLTPELADGVIAWGAGASNYFALLPIP